MRQEIIAAFKRFWPISKNFAAELDKILAKYDVDLTKVEKLKVFKNMYLDFEELQMKTCHTTEESEQKVLELKNAKRDLVHYMHTHGLNR